MTVGESKGTERGTSRGLDTDIDKYSVFGRSTNGLVEGKEGPV